MPFRIVTDYDLQAYVDNELGPQDQKRVQTFLRGNSIAQKRYNQLMQQRTLLNEWYGAFVAHSKVL